MWRSATRAARRARRSGRARRRAWSRRAPGGARPLLGAGSCWVSRAAAAAARLLACIRRPAAALQHVGQLQPPAAARPAPCTNAGHGERAAHLRGPGLQPADAGPGEQVDVQAAGLLLARQLPRSRARAPRADQHGGGRRSREQSRWQWGCSSDAAGRRGCSHDCAVLHPADTWTQQEGFIAMPSFLLRPQGQMEQYMVRQVSGYKNWKATITPQVAGGRAHCCCMCCRPVRCACSATSHSSLPLFPTPPPPCPPTAALH